MPIRLAKYTDIPAISSICGAAFYNDELFGDMMHPMRAQYPDDYEGFFIRRFREAWWDFSHVFWVAVVEEAGKEKVVGIAEWELKGTAGKHLKIGRADPRHLIKPTISTLLSLPTPFTPTNRAASPDPSKRNPFPGAYPFFAHHWKSHRRHNQYYLDLLAVHPGYQGRGLAKELVQWGLDRAREEGVSAGVISSLEGYRFYKSMGFDTEVGKCTEGEGNPLQGLKSGWILFRDVEGGERGMQGKV